MEGIELSTNEFKALSSKTRTNILKMLDERNYTLSEIASKTGMAPPTVKQHTSILADAGLVELRDEGRKWKYYSLTKKGKQIIESKQKQTNILIVLSTTIAIGLIALLFAGQLLQPLSSGMNGTESQGLKNSGQAEIIASDMNQNPLPGNCIALSAENEARCAEEAQEANCEELDINEDGTTDCKWEEARFDN